MLDDSKSVYDHITEDNPQIPFGSKLPDGRAYVAPFNCKGEGQQKLLGGRDGARERRVDRAALVRPR